MVTFILSSISLLIYYILLLDWLSVLPKTYFNTSGVSANIILCIIGISFFLSIIALFFGLFRKGKGIKELKEKFLNEIGIIYAISIIIIWLFLFISFILRGFMDWALVTIAIVQIRCFKSILTILSITPIILSVAFLSKSIKKYKSLIK